MEKLKELCKQIEDEINSRAERKYSWDKLLHGDIPIANEQLNIEQNGVNE